MMLTEGGGRTSGEKIGPLLQLKGGKRNCSTPARWERKDERADRFPRMQCFNLQLPGEGTCFSLQSIAFLILTYPTKGEKRRTPPPEPPCGKKGMLLCIKKGGTYSFSHSAGKRSPRSRRKIKSTWEKGLDLFSPSSKNGASFLCRGKKVNGTEVSFTSP